MRKRIVEWIRKWFKENGKNAYAVIGISGGKDSTITAALLVEALGKDRVYGVIMPDGKMADIEDAYKVVEYLGIPFAQVNINTCVTAVKTAVNACMCRAFGNEYHISEDVGINVPPRIRMTMLYAFAQALPGGGRVANTCNLSEDYVGYSTKYGDAAGDFSPLSMLTVTEILEIGDEMGIPYELVHKVPSDGLCGKTDEESLGFTYAVLDRYIRTGVCGNPAVKANIDRRHKMNLHKMNPMPRFDPDTD